MPEPRIAVLYDADCGFCRWTLALLLTWDREARLRPVAIQSPEGDRLLAGVPAEARLESAHAVTEDGRVASGGAAVPVIARVLPAGAPVALLGRALERPIDRGYRWVAANRTRLSRLVPAGRKARAAERIARHAERAARREA